METGRSADRAAELMDILDVRRPLLLTVAGGVSLLGVAVTWLFPGVLAPSLGVGAAVGVAACLLALSAAITADAADRVVRGPRHVRTSGGVLAAIIVDRDPGSSLIAHVDALIGEEGLRLAVAPTGVDAADSHRLVDALGERLAEADRRVLVVDISRSGMDEAGVAEASRGSVRLSEVVEMHPSLRLARLGPGRDLSGAIGGFARIARKLPRDVDAMLVATPGVRHSGVLPALTAVDRVLLLVVAGRTERAELMAVLDALDVAGVPAEVVLVDGHVARREVRVQEPWAAGGELRGEDTEAVTEPASEVEPEAEPEPEREAEPESGPESGLGTAPEPDAEPEPEPEDEPEPESEPEPPPPAAAWPPRTDRPEDAGEADDFGGRGDVRIISLGGGDEPEGAVGDGGGEDADEGAGTPPGDAADAGHNGDAGEAGHSGDGAEAEDFRDADTDEFTPVAEEPPPGGPGDSGPPPAEPSAEEPRGSVPAPPSPASPDEVVAGHIPYGAPEEDRLRLAATLDTLVQEIEDRGQRPDAG